MMADKLGRLCQVMGTWTLRLLVATEVDKVGIQPAEVGVDRQ